MNALSLCVCRVCVGKGDVFFAAVSDPDLINHYISIDAIDRTPSLLLNRLQKQTSLNLEAFYGDDGSISEWISRASLLLIARH